MLAGRAEPAPAQEHERLLKRARHGDAAGTGGTTAEALAAGGVGREESRPGHGGEAAQRRLMRLAWSEAETAQWSERLTRRRIQAWIGRYDHVSRR